MFLNLERFLGKVYKSTDLIIRKIENYIKIISKRYTCLQGLTIKDILKSEELSEYIEEYLHTIYDLYFGENALWSEYFNFIIGLLKEKYEIEEVKEEVLQSEINEIYPYMDWEKSEMCDIVNDVFKFDNDIDKEKTDNVVYYLNDAVYPVFYRIYTNNEIKRLLSIKYGLIVSNLDKNKDIEQEIYKQISNLMDFEILTKQ